MKRMRIGLVTARFNKEITEKLEAGALAYLESQKDVLDLDIWVVRVPGAVEIPLACQALLEKGCQGVVALGAVIRGGTAHFEYVCQSVERGLTELMLESGRPVGFGVLTVDDWHQAEERAGGQHGNKGAEAAQAVLEMAVLLHRIKKAKTPGFLQVELPVGDAEEVSSAVEKRKTAKKLTNHSTAPDIVK